MTNNVKAKIAPNIGPRLKESRKRLGLSQEELAQQLGISRRTVINYETETNPVLLAYLDQLEKLGADLHYMLFDIDSPDH